MEDLADAVLFVEVLLLVGLGLEEATFEVEGRAVGG